MPQTDAWLTLEASHPRWRVLLVKHGEQRAAGPGGGGAGSTLAAELIDLTLRSTAADSAHIGAQARGRKSHPALPAPCTLALLLTPAPHPTTSV